MNFIRTSCTICNSQNLEELHTFKNFPVYMGIADARSPLYQDMRWDICKNCGTIQLKELIDPNILYARSHNPAIGKTWHRHHTKLAEFINSYADQSTILEIGGGNRVLANKVVNLGNIKNYVIYDSNSTVKTDNNCIKLNNELFTENTQIDSEIDIVVHSHTLEHFYDPNTLIKKINDVLPIGGYMIFSLPLIDQQLKSKFGNALNFEHTYLVSETALKVLLLKNGFSIAKSFMFSKYNIFVVAKKEAASFSVEIINNYKTNREMFFNFIGYQKELVKRCNELFLQKKEKIYLFGAHIFSQYLINAGLDQNIIECILDDDPEKIGNMLYGTNLQIRRTEDLKDTVSPVLILHAAQYTEEIKENIISNINASTIFI